MFVEPKPFTQASFYAASLNCVPESFLHYQSQTMLLQSIVGVVDTEMGRARTPPNFFHPMILCRCPQSFLWSKAE